MRTVTDTINNVSSAIARVIQPMLVDAIFDDFALLAIMEQRGKVNMPPEGGYDITWPVVSGKLRTGTYQGLYHFPGQEAKVFDRASLEWKNAFADVVVSGPDALRARGPYAAFQLTDGLKQTAKMSISDEMGSQIYADGSGTNFDGTAAAIDDGTFNSSYAGIPRTAFAGWRSYVNGTGAAFSFPFLTSQQTKVTIGNDSVDLIMTTQELWNSANNRAQAHQIFDRGDGRNRVAALGFQVVQNLNAAIVPDSKCSSGHMWGINTDYVEMTVMQDRMWAWTGWDRIPGSDGYQAQFLLMANFMFKAPRMFFRLYNVTE